MVQPVIRALELMSAMGQHRLSTIAELQRATDLPKSTIHRFLATLIECGYVEKDVERSVYILSDKVLSLAAGFGIDSKLVKCSVPVARQLTKETQWPVAIGTLDYNAIVVQYSTRPFTPFTLRPSTVNSRFPLLGSALGQAYIGFCSDIKRRAILHDLQSDLSQDIPMLQSDRSLAKYINEAKNRGYGLRVGGRGDSSHIAMPVMQNEHVIGVIGISIYSSCYQKESSGEIVQKLEHAVTCIQDSMVRQAQPTEVERTGIS